MALKSTADRYGTVAILFHWVVALLIVGMMLSGLRAAGTDDSAAKAALLAVHAPVGLLVLALTVLRLAWWWIFDRKPAPVAGLPPWQERASRVVHGLLYLAIFGLVGSGMATMALSGAGDIVFDGMPGPLPDFWDYPPRLGHALFFWLLLALLAFHIGAALYHQFVRRDRLLARIGLGR